LEEIRSGNWWGTHGKKKRGTKKDSKVSIEGGDAYGRQGGAKSVKRWGPFEKDGNKV